MTKTSKATRSHKTPPQTSDIRHDTNRKSLVHPLAFLANDFRERIRVGLRQRNHQLQPTQAKVLVHMDIEGSRLTDLADRAGISKQAMGKIVDELERLGYVSRDSHADGRAKLIQFTRSGLKLLKDSGEIVDAVWQEYAELVGEKRLANIRDDLNELYGRVKQQRSEAESAGQ